MPSAGDPDSGKAGYVVPESITGRSTGEPGILLRAVRPDVGWRATLTYVVPDPVPANWLASKASLA